MPREWDELQPDFRRMVARRGVVWTARAVPVDRTTVYRIIRGETKRPQPAVVRCIDRLLDSERDRPPPDGD